MGRCLPYSLCQNVLRINRLIIGVKRKFKVCLECLLGKEGFNFPPQFFISSTGFLEEVRPLARFLAQGRLIKALYLLPSFGCHQVSR